MPGLREEQITVSTGSAAVIKPALSPGLLPLLDLAPSGHFFIYSYLIQGLFYHLKTIVLP